MTAPPPDYSDPLYGIPELPRRPVVASAPATGSLSAPEEHGSVRAYPGRTYGRAQPGEAAYPEQPPEDAVWPLVTGTPPRPRRRLLGITLVVTLVLLLAGGVAGAWVLIDPAGLRGADTPGQAVDGFLAAVYETHDARAAGRNVCGRARNDADLDQLVFQVKQNQGAYTAAQTTWSYPPIRIEGRQAAAEVTLTMTTANEQVASRVITVLLVDDRGWWVCDVREQGSTS
ncbi:MAG TPA: hypothetical protein VH561_05295 [Micromonosporaceae bacterium]|jgi:hypothetical protein